MSYPQCCAPSCNEEPLYNIQEVNARRTIFGVCLNHAKYYTTPAWNGQYVALDDIDLLTPDDFFKELDT